MAMNIGKSSHSDEPQVMIEINTTPLIDVMLVLLVMLIITIPIQLHAVNLDMPVGAPPTTLVKPEKIQLDIDDKSVVYWQGLPVTAQELETRLVQGSLLLELQQREQVDWRAQSHSYQN